jgi:hypothetical protein
VQDSTAHLSTNNNASNLDATTPGPTGLSTDYRSEDSGSLRTGALPKNNRAAEAGR